MRTGAIEDGVWTLPFTDDDPVARVAEAVCRDLKTRRTWIRLRGGRSLRFENVAAREAWIRKVALGAGTRGRKKSQGRQPSESAGESAGK